MKNLSRFLSLALCLGAFPALAAPVAQTAGSNLTAYNGNMGAINNNTWNAMMNNRTGTSSGAVADFGNCNALIMRCATPKCASGGCTSMDVTVPIVAGCVRSNETCARHGDDLIQYISAQLVASSTAKANAAANAASVAAANAAAEQSAQQLQQMQAQMQQMQSQMAAQNAQQMQQMQAALEEQKQLTAQAIADASAAQAASQSVQSAPAASADVGTLNTAQRAAAENGVSADILAREQITGQIMTKIENAQTALKALNATMQSAFEYAGCDKSGNNCAGPKRVKVFKQRAEQFFEPYNAVLDELYDALVLAQSVGVDITDIYMMLNGTCNAWAQYLCTDGQVMHYNNKNCNTTTGQSIAVGMVRGGAPCAVGQVVPMSDGGCQLVKMLNSTDEVQRNWLEPETGSTGAEVRVGCASEALDNSVLFRGRKKQASIDIETLQRIIEQDAPSTYGSGRYGNNKTPNPDGLRFCAINDDTLAELQKYASLKTLPTTVCITDTQLTRRFAGTMSGPTTASEISAVVSILDCASSNSRVKDTPECKCKNSGGTYYMFGSGVCSCPSEMTSVNGVCEFDADGAKRKQEEARRSEEERENLLKSIKITNIEIKGLEI